MFSATLENSLVVSLFQLLFTGLLLIVLCVMLALNRGTRSRPDVWLLAAVFFLLSGHLLFDTLDHYLNMAGPEFEPIHSLHVAVQYVEAGALALLIPTYFLWGRKVQR